MYQQARRERLRQMRTLPAQSPQNNVSGQFRTIVVLALFLFALSGLISGFAVGAFVRPKIGIGPHSNSNLGSETGAQKTSTANPKTTSHPVSLGYPVIDAVQDVVIANGSTTYTLAAHAVDQSIDKGHGKAVHAAGITCRLWLLKTSSNPLAIPSDRLISTATLSAPLPGEVSGLTFSSGTPQVQTTNTQGAVTWNYSIAPSIDAGRYYLMVLMDWQGVHYNWSWAVIRIKKGD